MSSSVERPRLRLGYRTMSSSSMKGTSPTKDESRADHPSSPDHHTKIPTPTKTNQSPRGGGQSRFGFSPRTNNNSFHRENSFDVEALSSNESLDARYASPPPPHRAEGTPQQPEHAPNVTSGFNGDDITTAHAENHSQAVGVAGPTSSGGPAGHKYDPKQYQDQQNDFHPVSKQTMVRWQMKKKKKLSLLEFL